MFLRKTSCGFVNYAIYLLLRFGTSIERAWLIHCGRGEPYEAASSPYACSPAAEGAAVHTVPVSCRRDPGGLFSGAGCGVGGSAVVGPLCDRLCEAECRRTAQRGAVAGPMDLSALSGRGVSAGLYSLGRDADPVDVRGPGLLPVVRGAVLCRCTGKAGRGIGAGGAGTAVSVHHTMSADDSGGQLCVCVAPGRTSKAGGERPAERDHLCVCIADRDSGGVRPGAAAFCMADARLDLKERGVRDT